MKQDLRFTTVAITTFLKKNRHLIFWLVWGIALSCWYGFVMGDYPTGFAVFTGFGILLGLTRQFSRANWPRRVALGTCLAVATAVFWKPAVSFVQVITNQKISRDFLVHDVRQMASILEEAHPDPYVHGGGKIAFHRKMQTLIHAIPEDGLTKTEFYRHLCPLLAAVRDGHTALWEPYSLNNTSPGGVPLHFQAVEDFLYVAGVLDPAHRQFIGSRLVSVESVPLDELLRRQARIKGCDNEYQVMRNLGYDGSLWHKERLRHLLPEWGGGSIHVVLMSPNGHESELALPPNDAGQDQIITAATSVTLPSTEKSNYVYRFMNEGKKTVLLVLENMYTYRESFEMELVLQGSRRTGLARQLYEKYNGQSPPLAYEDVIAGIPSATELCRELVQVMRENGTDNLIIDLRRNQGGNAFISSIFFYFLHGKETLISFSDRRSIFIRKYSPFFWKQYPDWKIEDINKHQRIQLTEHDYDFSGYPEHGSNLSRAESIRIIEEEASMAKTFWEEYQSGEYSGYYCPRNVLILCSPVTNSSGYAFMYDHWAAGGKVVGIPSSQAGNSFGAWVGFQLDYSRLKGGVSHLYATHFRDNPEMGRVFRPDYEMTYDDLKTFDFDPNAEVLYALRLVDSRNNSLD